jgi:hypothetical protein
LSFDDSVGAQQNGKQNRGRIIEGHVAFSGSSADRFLVKQCCGILFENAGALGALTMRLVAAFACALIVTTLPNPASGQAVTLAELDGGVSKRRSVIRTHHAGTTSLFRIDRAQIARS